MGRKWPAFCCGEGERARMVLDKGEELCPWPEPFGEAAEMVELMVKAALCFARAIHDTQGRQLLAIFFAQLGKPGPEMDSACQSCWSDLRDGARKRS